MNDLTAKVRGLRDAIQAHDYSKTLNAIEELMDLLATHGPDAIFGAEWPPEDDRDVWSGPRDRDGKPCRTIGCFECPECGTIWEDQWSCSCNDRCPECDTETSPHDSRDLDVYGRPVFRDLDG